MLVVLVGALTFAAGPQGAGARPLTTRHPQPPFARSGSHDDKRPRFFFYFHRKTTAQKIGLILKRRGYAIEIDPPIKGVPEWSLVATGTPIGVGFFAADDAMQRWADWLGIDYDGNGMPIG
jgi:hypothetical protein